jgi:putrescine transport system substrate-binding protein
MNARFSSLLAGAAMAAAVAAAASISTPSRADEPKQLNVYNWSDYIAEDTVPAFEKATGIKVTYDVYDSNETLEAKLLSGRTGYDIVVPSAMPFIAREIKAKAFRPIDKSKLPNYGNLDPVILEKVAAADPGNQYGVPYLWGTTGIGYNVAKVKAALGENAKVDSLVVLFDPENAKKLAGCGISVLDTAQELFPAALAYLGVNPLSRDPKDIERAAEAMTKIRPYIRKFHSSQYINDLANGDLCLAFGYSGDVIQARGRAKDAKNGVEIGYAIPNEGAMIWVDMMAIPADAPHPENALAFINHVLKPETIAAISNTVGYPNPNKAATELVDEEIRSDPQIYPPESVRAKLFFDQPVTPDFERLRTRAWTRVKSGT